MKTFLHSLQVFLLEDMIMTENKQLTGNQVRQMFLDFFASKGSMIEPGASLIPHNDPTLLWINAGVSALKKYFDGTEKPKCNRICKRYRKRWKNRTSPYIFRNARKFLDR